LLLICLVIVLTFLSYAAHQPGGDLVSKQETARAMTFLKQGSKPTPTPSPTFTVTSTPVQGPPYLAGTYKGSITDTMSHLTSHMTLVIKQLKGQANYTGQFTVD